MDFSRNNDLIAYNGAWMYPVEGGWEANLRGFHYSAETLDELKAKIDKYADENEKAFNIATSNDYARPVYGSGESLFEGAENSDDLTWIVQYDVSASQEYDDNMNDSTIREVIIEAPDFKLATKYAEQYAMMSAHDDPSWANAEIISIVQNK